MHPSLATQLGRLRKRHVRPLRRARILHLLESHPCGRVLDAPAGSLWLNYKLLGTVWTINPDGTFHVMSTKPKAQIWGTYTLSGDTITVQETRRAGAVPKNCKGPGVYKFSRPDANTLAFVLVNDVCKPRIQNVTQPWHRQ